jgi:hypothetical protein
LRREDFDGFEKKLRRTRRARLVLIPTLLLAALGAAAYLVFLRAQPVYKADREANNTLDTATLVAANSEITGYIGKRVSKSEPDVDFYRFTTKPEGEVVTISVAPPPTVDIRLNLYDVSGKLLKDTNEFGLGKQESLRRWRSTRAVAVSVAGVFTEGSGLTPVENVSDKYTLSVVFAPEDPRLESEPNDSRTDANTLSPGTPITGYLDHREDTDVYRIDAAAGDYKLLISGGPEVPFEWRLNDAASWRGDLQTTITLAAGSVLSIRRKKGKSRTAADELLGADSPYAIDLSQ